MIPAPLIPLLVPLAAAYRGGLWLRASLYARGVLARHRLHAPVISVGNLVVGGTGKTPLVSWLARQLRDRGLRVVILSRGYRRKGRGVVVVSDGRTILADAASAGDEPLLLARDCTGVVVVVGADRALAGAEAEARFAPDVVLLDDGFQHLGLARALDLVLVDATSDLGRLRLLPAGPLREPLAALARASVVLVSRAHRERDPAAIDAVVRRFQSAAPILRVRPRFVSLAGVEGGERPVADLRGARVVAVSAIANPAGFETDLALLGADVAARLRWRDHHRFDRRDVDRIGRVARQSGADLVVTTAKDLVRLESLALGEIPLCALRMEVEVERGEALLEQVVGLVTAPVAAAVGA